MAITEESIRHKLMDALKATHCEVIDTSNGCGQGFDAIIVSPEFEGKKVLEKHRMVNEVLADELSKIHSFSQKSYTPAQWDSKQPSA